MSKLTQWLNGLSPGSLRWLMNVWPPFLGSGIKVKYIAADYHEIKVCLKLHWYNQNYVGSHFGGAMLSMTDPFFMLMLIRILGSNYIVWDKATYIKFVKPGHETLSATFKFSKQEITAIQSHTDKQPKYVFDKSVEIINQQGEVVAAVTKTLYVRNKSHP